MRQVKEGGFVNGLLVVLFESTVPVQSQQYNHELGGALILKESESACLCTQVKETHLHTREDLS